MFQPNYQLAPRLLTALTTIERLYGQIEALKVPQKLSLNLTRNNLIRSTYASNRIEGNPLSEAEVTNLILNDRVPVNRDEKEVIKYFALLSNLKKYTKTPLGLNMITDFHKQLLEGLDPFAGEIRDVQVVVGHYKKERGDVSLRVKHNPPFHKRTEISKSLVELLDWITENSELPAVIQAGLFHHHFVYIHPFEDGNGRVCRLLTALILLKRGYEINRYFVLDDYYDVDRDHYSDMLHSADKGDLTVWLTYFADGMKYSLQSALVKYEDAMRTLNFEERPTPQEHKVLNILKEYPEVTAPDAAKKLGVTRQQAHFLLKALVDKGLVEKHGKTKKSYYEIK